MRASSTLIVLIASVCVSALFFLTTCSKIAAVVAAPTITSVSPTSGSASGGTSLSIVGTKFQSGATIKLGAAACTNTSVASATSITTTTAAHAAGTVDLVVTNPDGQATTLAAAFVYTSGSPAAPTVSSVSPSSGSTAGGTSVTIAGTAFQTGATATFGGDACASPSVSSASQMQCTTPSHAAGVADVVVINPDSQSGTLAGGFTYSAAADFTVTNSGASAYIINNSSNPTLTLTRGTTYTFSISSSGHPFYIKSVQGSGTGNAYNTGVTNNGIDSGTITFAVPPGAPNTLYYNCEFHDAMTGTIQVQN